MSVGRAAHRKILVVDDDAVVRSRSASILTAAGMEVLQAEDGFAALAILSRRSLEIVLLIADTEMPGMDGYDLIHRARILCPSLRFLRLARDTNAAPPAEVSDCRSVPAVSKPLAPSTLLAHVRLALASGAQNGKREAPTSNGSWDRRG